MRKRKSQNKMMSTANARKSSVLLTEHLLVPPRARCDPMVRSRVLHPRSRLCRGPAPCSRPSSSPSSPSTYPCRYSSTLPPRPGRAEGCVHALPWCVHLGVDPVLQNPVSVPSSVFVRHISPPEGRGCLPEEVAVTSLASVSASLGWRRRTLPHLRTLSRRPQKSTERNGDPRRSARPRCCRTCTRPSPKVDITKWRLSEISPTKM